MSISSITDEQHADLERLRDYLAGSDFTDREKWIGAIDRATGRKSATDGALKKMLNPKSRMRIWRHGALKAFIARAKPGETLHPPSYAQACSFRTVAKVCGRRAKVATIHGDDGRRTITVTLLD